MSNIKHFHLVFSGPHDLLSGTGWTDYPDGPLYTAGRHIAQSAASMLLNPVSEVTYVTEENTPVPNKHGGMTSIYTFHIDGYEAYGWGFFDELKEAIERVPHTTIHTWNVYDWEEAQREAGAL